MSEREFSANLERFVASEIGASAVATRELRKLSGGAVQENWAWDVAVEGGDLAGERKWVVRTDRASGVSESLTRAQEYALLLAAGDAGVAVPRPVALCPDDKATGRPFYVMERCPGTAAGHRLVKDEFGFNETLTERMGRELAKIHSISPPRDDLDFLGAPPEYAEEFAIRKFQAYLDELPEVYPAIQWGLSWADRRRPDPSGDIVLTHHDYRTGNYMVDENGLTGILDWEFAGWSDPHEDIAWFCAKCWRFGRNDREAGGIGAREDFYRGYSSESGREIDPMRVHFWEVMAHIRWAVIAVQQAWRHLSGEEPNLELALTGRIVPELELEILMLTEEADEGRVES